MITFSKSFDINYYRNMYPELQGMGDDVVKLHYDKYAVHEGRTTCIYDRSEYMRAFLNQNITDETVLEIGPFDRPFLEKGNVKYFDVMNSDELRERARVVHRVGGHVPDKIDYISPEADLGIIKDKFDIVISSHVIEHQPNLIEHFQLVENMLNHNGLYILYIPDKRYCFDYYLPETCASELISAFVYKPKVHSLKSVIEHLSMITHNNPLRHWFGDHGDSEISRDAFVKAVDTFISSKGEYIDVHAWQFTPHSFANIVQILNKLQFLNLHIYRLCHTVFGRQEFCAILKRD